MGRKTKAPHSKATRRKNLLHALQKEKKGYTSSRKCLEVSFFEENTAVPAHADVPLFLQNVVLSIPYPGPKSKQNRAFVVKSCPALANGPEMC